MPRGVTIRNGAPGTQDVGRFASTVPFYERTRQPYGDDFFASVAQTLGLDRRQRLLDLGTGPGLLALGFAAFVCEVWGVDPEPAMIAVARANAERSGVALHLIEGTTEDLPRSIGHFDVVTIGRALHWMDPARTRAAFERIVDKGGCILVCAATSAADGRNPWLVGYEALRDRWCADHGLVRYRERQAFFEGTRFRGTGRIEVAQEYAVSVETLADRILSMSSTSPEKLGATSDTVRHQAREWLAPFADHGLVRETVVARAEIFRDEQGG